MPAVRARLRRRQIALEMRVLRTGNVRFEIELFTLGRVGEIEPAVDDDPLFVGQERSERRRID